MGVDRAELGQGKRNRRGEKAKGAQWNLSWRGASDPEGKVKRAWNGEWDLVGGGRKVEKMGGRP